LQQQNEETEKAKLNNEQTKEQKEKQYKWQLPVESQNMSTKAEVKTITKPNSNQE
jgi:hypothetical protein